MGHREVLCARNFCSTNKNNNGAKCEHVQHILAEVQPIYNDTPTSENPKKIASNQASNYTLTMSTNGRVLSQYNMNRPPRASTEQSNFDLCDDYIFNRTQKTDP